MGNRAPGQHGVRPCGILRSALLNSAVTAMVLLAQNSQLSGARARRNAPDGATDACRVQELTKSDLQGLKIYAPDGHRYLVSMEDSKGVAQVYVGSGTGPPACITCSQVPGGPRPSRFKLQPVWHPSGDWIFVAVERDHYSKPPILGWSRQYVEGMLQCGLWTNMWAVSPDGASWHRLTDFRSNVPGVANGYTGPAFTPDGRKAVWSQIIDGNIFAYWPFGRWQLILADVGLTDDGPKLAHLRDITPDGMYWNEPGNFAPDNHSLLLSGSVEKDAQGMDQYILSIDSLKLTNLTSSPTVWDEHGVFSPDGRKILFMSAYPYRDDPKASHILTIKTEFMLMNRDGSGLTQLTHFKTPGYPEYSKAGIAATAFWNADGASAALRELFFPKLQDWIVVFDGPCGLTDR